MDECERQVASFLTDFILESSLDTLKKFLTFVTGRPCLPSFGLQKMDLKFADGESGSIFASTCLCEITLPKTFKRKDDFFMSLEAVIDTNGKSFNCF